MLLRSIYLGHRLIVLCDCAIEGCRDCIRSLHCLEQADTVAMMSNDTDTAIGFGGDEVRLGWLSSTIRERCVGLNCLRDACTCWEPDRGILESLVCGFV